MIARNKSYQPIRNGSKIKVHSLPLPLIHPAHPRTGIVMSHRRYRRRDGVSDRKHKKMLFHAERILPRYFSFAAERALLYDQPDAIRILLHLLRPAPRTIRITSAGESERPGDY